jgi:hypothetical protein
VKVVKGVWKGGRNIHCGVEYGGRIVLNGVWGRIKIVVISMSVLWFGNVG